MKVSLIYFAQLRDAAGTGSETVELPCGADLAAAISDAARRHGEAFRKIALDESGNIRPSLLVTVNGKFAARGAVVALNDGDEISLLSPIAGG
ncbi:MAG: MoaD/ThiS family protein [Planctomycetota bacterium]|nr:MoaD/ThiS family protein [Planctomycetota bacterium]